jgi:hypothetical protein
MCFLRIAAHAAKLLAMPLLLFSCTTAYYQVYTASPENGTISKDEVVFENDHCTVSYNLWSNGGDVGFTFFNKTDKDITLDLTKSFFVINGYSKEYFRNRSYSGSWMNGLSQSRIGDPYPYYYSAPKVITGTAAASKSITFVEKPEITVPAGTKVQVAEYTVTDRRFVDCDLKKYPQPGTTEKLDFDRSGSPFVFYNLITYRTSQLEKRFENRFHVSSIANFPSSAMFTTVDTSMCGRTLSTPEQVFRSTAPNTFYFQYLK